MENLEGITDATYLNSVISKLSDKIDTKYISDGNYTFQQLYDYIAYVEALYVNVLFLNIFNKTHTRKEKINENEFYVQIIYENILKTKKYSIKYFKLFNIPEKKIVPYNLTDFLLS